MAVPGEPGGLAGAGAPDDAGGFPADDADRGYGTASGRSRFGAAHSGGLRGGFHSLYVVKCFIIVLSPKHRNIL